MINIRGATQRLGIGSDAVDMTGIAVFCGFVAWLYVAGRAAGDAGPRVATAVAACGVFLLARAVGRQFSWVAPLAVVVAAAALWASDPIGTVSRSPLSGPLGYTNATSAFFIQAVLAGLMIVVSPGAPSLRAGAGFAAVVLLSVPVIADSRSTVMLALACPALGLAVWGPQMARVAIRGCGVVLALGLGTTVFIGSLYQSNSPYAGEGIVRQTLSERRAQLWSESLDLIGKHPLTGVGPGRFAAVSPTAQVDADARWAHNEFLQSGAEMGIPGMALLAALFGWTFLRLLSVPHPGPATAVGAVALAVIGLHACIDYVLHFPLVPIAAAAVVGSAVGSSEG